MPECPPSRLQQQDIWQQVQQLHNTQTAPFELLVSDYTGCLQRKRDLEVCLHHWQQAGGASLPCLVPFPHTTPCTAGTVNHAQPQGHMLWRVLDMHVPVNPKHTLLLPLCPPAGACGCAGA